MSHYRVTHRMIFHSVADAEKAEAALQSESQPERSGHGDEVIIMQDGCEREGPAWQKIAKQFGGEYDCDVLTKADACDCLKSSSRV
jgi:hypothetical protein